MDPAHLFAGPHRCRYCPESFSTPDKLERHVAHRHPWLRRVRWGAAAAVGLLAIGGLVFVLQPGPEPPLLAAFEVGDDPMMGTGQASVQAIVIESPSCQDCAWFHREVLGPRFNRTLSGVDLWFLSGEATTPLDRAAAIAQECSNEHAGVPGFLAFSDRLYANQSSLDEHVVHVMLQDFSNESGIAEETVMRCYYAEETGAVVDDDVRVARAHDAGPGTVFLIQDGHLNRMDIRNFAAWLDTR